MSLLYFKHRPQRFKGKRALLILTLLVAASTVVASDTEATHTPEIGQQTQDFNNPNQQHNDDASLIEQEIDAYYDENLEVAQNSNEPTKRHLISNDRLGDTGTEEQSSDGTPDNSGASNDAQEEDGRQPPPLPVIDDETSNQPSDDGETGGDTSSDNNGGQSDQDSGADTSDGTSGDSSGGDAGGESDGDGSQPSGGSDETGGESQLPAGCVDADRNGKCTQCNGYSILDEEWNECICEFDYKVDIEAPDGQSLPKLASDNSDGNEDESQDDSTDNQGDLPLGQDADARYAISIYTFLDIDRSVFSGPDREKFECTDVLLFIFEDRATLNSLGPDAREAWCKLNQIFYLIFDPNSTTPNYNNVLRIENLKWTVVDAFIKNKIEFAFDYSVLTIECVGGDDFLVTNAGIQWPEEPEPEPTQPPEEEPTQPPEEEPTQPPEEQPEEPEEDNGQGDLPSEDEQEAERKRKRKEEQEKRRQCIKEFGSKHCLPKPPKYDKKDGGYICKPDVEDEGDGLGQSDSDCVQPSYNLTFEINNETEMLNRINITLWNMTFNGTDGDINCTDILLLVYSNSSDPNVTYTLLDGSGIICSVYTTPAQNETADNSTEEEDNSTEQNDTSENQSQDQAAVDTQDNADSDQTADQTDTNDLSDGGAADNTQEQTQDTTDEQASDSSNGEGQVLQSENQQWQSVLITMTNIKRDYYDNIRNNTLDIYVKLLNLTWLISEEELGNCTKHDSFMIGNDKNNTIRLTIEPVRCPDDCDDCDNETGLCNRCKEGYLLVSNEKDTYSCIENPCNETERYNISSSECVYCAVEGCSMCDAEGNCTECQPGSFRLEIPGSPLQCVQHCPVNMFTNFRNGSCSACDPECEECANNPNYDCRGRRVGICDRKKDVEENGEVVRKGTMRCVDKCPNGWYSALGFCHQCGTNCDRCAAFDKCTRCEQFSVLQEGVCRTDVCEDGEFINSRGRCQSCHRSCLTCHRNENTCTSCRQGFKLVNNKCVEETTTLTLQQGSCAQGQYWSQDEGKCVGCPSGCVSCSNNKTCSQCSSITLSLINNTDNTVTCVRGCPNGYYQRNANRSCIRCAHDNCKVCSPVTSCWTCNEGFFRTRTACINDCPTGQYMGQDFLKYYQCMNCPSNCLDCDTVDTCNTCATPNIKVMSPYPDVSDATVQKAVKATCVSTPLRCPNGTFYNETGNVCQVCPRGCATCDRTGNCLTNCSSDCSDCIARPARCIKCQPGEEIVTRDNGELRCEKACQGKGQFYNRDNLTCENCISNCSKCTNASDCQLCANSTWKHTVNGSLQCIEQCPEGWYGDQLSGQCKKCSKNCQKCDNATRCTACDQTTVLDSITGRCYCALRYRAFWYSNSPMIQVDFWNIEWSSSFFDLLGGGMFNCSQIFDFNPVNATISANPDFSEELESLEDLQCQANYAPDGNYAQVLIHGTPTVLQAIVRLGLVTIQIKNEVYRINCVTYQPVFSLAVAAVSTDEEQSDENTRRLETIMIDGEYDEVDGEDSLMQNQVMIVTLACVIIAMGILIMRKLMNKKPRRLIKFQESSRVEEEIELQNRQ